MSPNIVQLQLLKEMSTKKGMPLRIIDNDN